jgi:peptide/nickel transport system permease protein
VTAIDLPGAEETVVTRAVQQYLRNPLVSLLKFIRRKPLGAFGGFLVVAFLFIAITSPFWVPFDARKSVALPLLSPSGEHWLGTDALGQDVFSRVLVGSQISLAIGFSVTLIYAVLGTGLGLVAGYYQGPVDYLIQRSGEIWSAFPYLVALLLIVAILGPPFTRGGAGPFALIQIAWDMRNLVFAFSIGAVFGGSRLIRGVALSLKQADYVVAAKALGASDMRIIMRHLLPNVMPFVIVNGTASLGFIILGEAALSFLGLGVAPGTPSWGQDISGRNRSFMFDAPWVVLAPGVAISMTVLGFNLFGDALRDILDPRLRGT